MYPHHQATIDRVVEHFQADPVFPALIVGGSLVKGWGRPDSDVDIVLVATDEEYARRAAEKNITYATTEFCDYPGGYVDVKIVDISFLHDVAKRGSEPARSAYVKAYLAYSRLPELSALLTRIPVYQEANHTRKLESFYTQVQALQWFVSEAEKRQNPYLMMHAVSDLVLFGGRMILAHNRILYPYHKWFLTELERAPQKPDHFMEHLHTLLAQPNKVNADQFCETLLNFTDWPKPTEIWPTRFLFDSEWNWRHQSPPLEDC
jgi:hypothetical protein